MGPGEHEAGTQRNSVGLIHTGMDALLIEVIMQIPTVQVKDGKGGFFVINVSDFDETKHEVYIPESEKMVVEPEAKKTKAKK